MHSAIACQLSVPKQLSLWPTPRVSSFITMPCSMGYPFWSQILGTDDVAYKILLCLSSPSWQSSMKS